MGKSRFEKSAAHRKYEEKYALLTAEGIGRLLKEINQLKVIAYDKGDFAAVDIILDLKVAMNKANLTHKQHQAIFLLYHCDLTLSDAAKVVGTDISTLSRHQLAAVKKIARIYYEWNYVDRG